MPMKGRPCVPEQALLLPPACSLRLPRLGESQAVGLEGLFPPRGVLLGQRKMLEVWKHLTAFPVAVPQFLPLGCFPLSLLDAITPPVQLSCLPPESLVAASVPLLHSGGQPFLHGCWLISDPFKTQLSASYSTTPSPIQQQFNNSFVHPITHSTLYLKPVPGQTPCQALGYRDQPDAGSACESFSE